jgi:SAM-dependent methyltransferase
MQGAAAFGPGRFQERLRRLRHLGRRRECVFCGARVRAFWPYGERFPVLAEQQVVGGMRRRDSQCPVCKSLDRERLVLLYLRHETGVFRETCTLLHVAPERRLRAVLAGQPNITYLTADARRRDVTLTVDIAAIPLPDATFDAVFCNHVLEHVPDDRRALVELRRVLKPGGWALLQVPISLTLAITREDPAVTSRKAREQAFGQYDHVRLYGADYPTRLAAAGFEVEIFQWPRSAAYGGETNRYGLNPRERLFIARRPA